MKQLEKLFELQAGLQRRLQPDFADANKPLTEIARDLQRNFLAFSDEMLEILEATGGVNDGVGKGVWKYWKTSHDKAKTMTIDDLSEGDRALLVEEVVDSLHFWINIPLMLGITADEIYDMYITKNDVNHKRKDSGY